MEKKCAAATVPISIPFSQISGTIVSLGNGDTELGVNEGENSEQSSGSVAGLAGCPSSTHSTLGSNFHQICARASPSQIAPCAPGLSLQ